MNVGDIFYKKCTITEMSQRVPGKIAEWQEDNFDLEKHDAEILNNIYEYLKNKENELYNLMNNLTQGSEMYKEVRAKHVELLHILNDLGLNIDEKI